ncbi:hypothetical protein J1N10_19935 [Carboxylicivirga sp. A043]|uniref:hypothetical protein n=1 Tax=Carboxylicivirga litoralis TaxID=2816963 RepID=UPI0021CAFE67|nr:hypothetical protein [Carboxylicivirga sp. A043]MCU4158254.1 hypothetical protein [Carboxylicivirga sp. A043]
MDNFSDLLKLGDIIEKVPEHLRDSNFEKLYGNLHSENPNSELLREIEGRILDYFGSMQLPDEPTIYDYLVLSLRGKDLIATFNWDPFLYQAWVRNKEFTDDLPRLAFLHGNVAVGYSKEDKRCGPVGYQMRRDGGVFEPTKLLYPVEQKNYTEDEFINIEWGRVRYWLSKESGARRVTIFGYGAPVSDVEAVSLLNTAWGTPDERDMEQFEVIDISSEEELRKRWDGFIHSHHYDVYNDFFLSSIALNPRRTSESFFCHYMPMTPGEAFRVDNPVPTNFKTLKELWDWYRPLIEAEEKAQKEDEADSEPKTSSIKKKPKKKKPKKKSNKHIVVKWKRKKRSKRTRIRKKSGRKRRMGV